MAKTKTSRYDVAEHLRTPEEMAAYLEACLEEANGDAAFIAKALGDIVLGPRVCHKWLVRLVCPAKAFIKHSRENELPVLTQYLKLSALSG
jgi:hypothetical protein